MVSVREMFRRGFVALALGGFVAIAVAHPGHGEAISKDEAVRRANAQINRLVTAGKLEKSWKMNAKLQTASLAEKGEAREWAVTFSNDSAGAQQRTLYVFLSETGEYLAANFTGR